jgi:hypothetical protein
MGARSDFVCLYCPSWADSDGHRTVRQTNGSFLVTYNTFSLCGPKTQQSGSEAPPIHTRWILARICRFHDGTLALRATAVRHRARSCDRPFATKRNGGGK